jgi:hypothetical protein
MRSGTLGIKIAMVCLFLLTGCHKKTVAPQPANRAPMVKIIQRLITMFIICIPTRANTSA